MVARYSRWKLPLYLLGALGFVALGALMAADHATDSEEFFVGSVGMALFGLFAVIFLIRAFDGRDILVIDDWGVFDRRVVDCPVPWSDIAAIGTYRVRRQLFYILTLKKPLAAYTTSRSKRFLQSLNRVMVDGLFIAPHGLTAEMGEIGSALARFAPAETVVMIGK